MRPARIASLDGIVLDALVHEVPGQPRGTLVLAHGITSDMDEGGMYARLADRLADAGLNAVRFSFRGHGHSGGTDRGVTISGEMLDLEAVIAWAGEHVGRVTGVVAASFGAVPVCLSLAYLEGAIERLVFWNPVLDLVDTFIAPTLPWGIEQFGDVARVNLRRDGTSLTDGMFQLGRAMFREMAAYDPLAELRSSPVPLLIIHGDRDSSVSYAVSRDASEELPECRLITIEGADHGFGSDVNVTAAIDATVEWFSPVER